MAMQYLIQAMRCLYSHPVISDDSCSIPRAINMKTCISAFVYSEHIAIQSRKGHRHRKQTPQNSSVQVPASSCKYQQRMTGHYAAVKGKRSFLDGHA